MKKLLIALSFFIVILFAHNPYAKAVKIVDVQGDVMVKPDASSSWQRAQLDLPLKEEGEIKTRKNSELTIAFDEELKNVSTIKENSHIKINDLMPVDSALYKGRVFSLIESIEDVEGFEIRTPTAIAGVRGTGWFIESKAKGSAVFCFESVVYVNGIDKMGNSTGKEDLKAGFGINIDNYGTLGKIFKLNTDSLDEWNKFKGSISKLRKAYAETTTLGEELRAALSGLFNPETGLADVSNIELPLFDDTTAPPEVSNLADDITLNQSPTPPVGGSSPPAPPRGLIKVLEKAPESGLRQGPFEPKPPKKPRPHPYAVSAAPPPWKQ